MIRKGLLLCCALMLAQGSVAQFPPLSINQIQFVGSHNSYKQAMSPLVFRALHLLDAKAAESLEYWHEPIATQLDLGLRKLEIDIFWDAQTQDFPVGHAQVIDMNTHCTTLHVCLKQIIDWSQRNPRHVPIWISFNLKDQAISGLPEPEPFTPEALRRLDDQLLDALGERLIKPKDVENLRWPPLEQSRGKF